MFYPRINTYNHWLVMLLRTLFCIHLFASGKRNYMGTLKRLSKQNYNIVVISIQVLIVTLLVTEVSCRLVLLKYNVPKVLLYDPMQPSPGCRSDLGSLVQGLHNVKVSFHNDYFIIRTDLAYAFGLIIEG